LAALQKKESKLGVQGFCARCQSG